MRYCNQCGSPLEMPTASCPVCGADVSYTLNGSDAPAPEAPPTPEPPPPPFEEAPPTGPHYARVEIDPNAPNELSPLQYFLLLVLFSLPVVGFIAILVVAFGARHPARRNLGQGMLLFVVARAVLFFFALIIAAVMLFRSGVVDYIMEELPYYLEDYYYYDDWDFPFDPGEFGYYRDFEGFGSEFGTSARDVYAEAFAARTGYQLI